MTKKLLISLFLVILLVGALAGTKVLQIRKMIAQGESFAPPPAIVTTTEVGQEIWQTALTAVGTLEAVQGVNLTAEESGRVTRINFESGQKVTKGQLLVQQNVATEQAQLQAARAQAQLAEVTEKRTRTLLDKKMVSQAEYDSAKASLQQGQAEVIRLQAEIAKKTIRAPFTGTLGLRQVNLGQTLMGGEAIVSLQSLDPIYANFRLPQQKLGKLEVGQSIRLTTDALPGQTLEGTLTAITPDVDSATRNLRLQATLPNKEGQLRPGMFVQVELPLPQDNPSLVLPATAILYAPYGNSIFRLKKGPEDAEGNPSQVLEQSFVRLGRTRGDFVEVLEGLTAEDVVVSTGVFKLRNGQTAVVNNQLNPTFQKTPKPEDQ